MKEKFENAPEWLMWIMTFINRIGFPIAVAIYLGYVQLNSFPKLVEALKNVNESMITVNNAIRDNTEVLRTWRYPRDRG